MMTGRRFGRTVVDVMERSDSSQRISANKGPAALPPPTTSSSRPMWHVQDRTGHRHIFHLQNNFGDTGGVLPEEMNLSMVLFLVFHVLTAICVLGAPHLKIKQLRKGLLFKVKGVTSSVLCINLHYSINKPVRLPERGEWHVKIHKSHAGQWIHINNHVSIHTGDVVHYWAAVLHAKWIDTIAEHTWLAIGLLRNHKSQNFVWQSRNLRLVFEDHFTYLDHAIWRHEISAYGGGNGEFQMYVPDRENSYTRNGILYIKPTLTIDKFEKHFLHNGTLDLYDLYGNCTNPSNYGCHKNGKNQFINPVMSAKLKSKARIRYGRVEVMAKMPRGDWLWPAIWLLSANEEYGSWPRSGEIDIVECRGNENYNKIGIKKMKSTVHYGAHWGKSHRSIGKGYSLKYGTFADGFHKYVLDWSSNYIRTYVDDRLVLNLPTPTDGFWNLGCFTGKNIWLNGGGNAPFDKKFFLILNVAVGGTRGFFVDGIPHKPYPKPWHDSSSKDEAAKQFWKARHYWYPTWKGENAAMKIKYVKMWEEIV